MSMETDTTRSTCLWVPDKDGIWTSECNHKFFFDTDGPHENGFKFCPYCGKPLEAVHANN